jgi:hypothetical protein
MDTQAAACIGTSGDILEGLVDWHDAATVVEIENTRRRINKAIEKGERILTRIWANKRFHAFVQKRGRAMYAAYLEYRAVGWRIAASSEKDIPNPESEGRAARLVELLHACVHMLPYEFFVSNRLVAKSGIPRVKSASDSESEETARYFSLGEKLPESTIGRRSTKPQASGRSTIHFLQIR